MTAPLVIGAATAAGIGWLVLTRPARPLSGDEPTGGDALLWSVIIGAAFGVYLGVRK